jgi:serine/threonine-protein kinase HipA
VTAPRPARQRDRRHRSARSGFDIVLDVHLADRPQPVPVGRLAQRGHDVFFEYDTAFLAAGIELSPLGLPLVPGVQQEPTRIFAGLHGVFFDSLPDGWGLRLMDREFASRGIEPATVTPLERLQCVGTRAMGGLTYHPSLDFEPGSSHIQLDELAAQSERIYDGSPEQVLPALMTMGGSAAGARPKVLVAYNLDTNDMRAGADVIPAGYRAYLIKFPTAEDGADIGAVEMAYAEMARAAGVTVPPTQLFTTDQGRRCFGVERFDRVGAERRHVHTLGGLLHVSHRDFGCTYTEYLRVVAGLTRDRRETLQAFRRMVFNVLAYNRDDHVKNFAFLMDPTGTWRLTPAYDLVYAAGPAGEHSMMVGTEGARPTYRNFLEVAERAAITAPEVAAIVQQVAKSVNGWPRYARTFGVTQATTAKISEALGRASRDGLEGRPRIL